MTKHRVGVKKLNLGCC